MKPLDFSELLVVAKENLNPKMTARNCEAGHVSCALQTTSGTIYTGVAITVPCGIGFCAEHAAIAAMINNDESRISKLVTVYKDGSILAPCGRCREFISQVDDQNDDCQILLENNIVATLAELLPEKWDKPVF
nr:Blasticidin-S deaminase [uncultured bacterium]